MTQTTTPATVTPQQLKPARRKIREGRGQGSANWVVKLAVALICLLWIIPTIGLLVTSFRTSDAAQSSGWWTVVKTPLSLSQWTVSNYDTVLNNPTTGTGFGISFVNSLGVALPATVIPILFAAFCAYAFTFMEFKGRDTIFVIIVALLIVPNQVAFVPLLKIYGHFHLNGTFPAVWLAHCGFGMSLAVFILRNYMSTLPKAVIESAKIDGASHFTTFWRLILPMSVPALASFAIFQFLWVWNDLLVALLFLGQGNNSVLTVNLAGLLSNFGQGWQFLTAGAFLTMLVPVIVFLSLQRYFIRGLTSGAVKG